MRDHDHEIVNKSGNRPFADVLRAHMSRRSLLQRSAALSATGFVAALAGKEVLEGLDDDSNKQNNSRRRRRLVRFKPVSLADGNAEANGAVPVISSDYEYQVLIPWGTPIRPGVTAYTGDPNTRPSSADQARMIGIGHDGMWFFPLEEADENGEFPEEANERGILCINHEFGRNTHVLGKEAPENIEDVRLSQHAHGVSVVEISRNRRGRWDIVTNSRNNRRIHVNTPMEFDGSAADSALLSTPAGNPRLGTVNNCANGYTPWGTYLTCEENFNLYFGATNPDAWTPTEAQDRYGFSEDGAGYGWHNFDPRFDLSNPQYTNEENRFGWIVEIDPNDRSQAPVKHTALGRFKHEGIATTEDRTGRLVGYMGDDQRFDYIYKFVSAQPWRQMLENGNSPLSRGQLFVARFDEDGTGRWLELTIKNPALASQFSSQDEVLTYARLAADILGATPMDRPEWTTIAPDGRVYCSLTNNSRRETADAANPLAPNADGHIIRWRDTPRGGRFEWDIYIIAETTHGTRESFADPDGLWADPDGRLFIETDGGQKDGLNNQLLVADIRQREIRRLFVGVNGDEITGLAVTPDRTTLFCNTQHPGNGDPTETNFPALTDGVTIPRDCTIVITRKDGGIVGS
ncbi:MAG: PhoX family phosphatase [Cyanothece sp. SIO2G6]|nr:PhoX family phosphatase [Cyanothece sp. SIO2G6]